MVVKYVCVTFWLSHLFFVKFFIAEACYEQWCIYGKLGPKTFKVILECYNWNGNEVFYPIQLICFATSMKSDFFFPWIVRDPFLCLYPLCLWDLCVWIWYLYGVKRYKILAFVDGMSSGTIFLLLYPLTHNFNNCTGESAGFIRAEPLNFQDNIMCRRENLCTLAL